ncbi:hypothetical protein F2P45_34885, partial [Massilia sp. CCM 8733]|nr:hypothetical protein [Massilia mucilaginosa]
DFAGGGLSSDLGPVLLRGVDLQIGLTRRLAAALPDRRHQSYVVSDPSTPDCSGSHAAG